MIRRKATAWCAASLASGLLFCTGLAAGTSALELRHVRLELPGLPAALIATDLDGDARPDLLVVLAYTEIDELGYDRVESAVQISTVIPALFARREVRAWLARPDGQLDPAGTLSLPPSVLSIAADPTGDGALVLTDDGVARLSWEPDPGGLVMESRIAAPPVFRESDSFFTELDWTVDVDGDGDLDLVVPTSGGPTLYLTGEDGIDETLHQTVRFPFGASPPGPAPRIDYPRVRFEDVDGDRRPDLLLHRSNGSAVETFVFLGDGNGAFRPARGDTGRCVEETALLPVVDEDGGTALALDYLRFVGDLDEDGRAEVVVVEPAPDNRSGPRTESKQETKPRQLVRLHRIREDLSIVAEPYHEFDAIGHTESDFDLTDRWTLFRDLDGNGSREMIVLTLDFSTLQAMRVFTKKRVSVGLDFHVWAQDGSGRFREIPGLDLSETLKLNLGNLRLSRLAQFGGDFDGDGRVDFVHVGRGKQVTVHRGQPGCRYPAKPDRMITLDEEPQDLALVRIGDLDGDGRADLSITRVLPVEKAGVTPPAYLDLYLSDRGEP